MTILSATAGFSSAIVSQARPARGLSLTQDEVDEPPPEEQRRIVSILVPLGLSLGLLACWVALRTIGA